MYLKFLHFLSHNLILFSEKNYKKQAKMFYQNHSEALHCRDILQFDFRINRTKLEKSRTALLGSD